MGLTKHSYNDGGYGDVPSRPSSANSFNSNGDYANRGGYRGGYSGGYNGGNSGGHNGGYNGGYKSGYGQGNDQSDSNYNRSSRQNFDQVDQKLMSRNAGQLGLDPTNMPPIKKTFYTEHPTITAMTSSQVDEFRKSAQMIIAGRDIPKPILEFNQAGFPLNIEKKLEGSGFSKPTPIQSQGWSMALTGQNMVGIAQTGSGKTLSFILPALVHIKGQAPLARDDGPIALVLAPTRELAVQIQDVARVFGNSIRVNSTCLYGGAPKSQQIRNVRNGCEIIIATPGRLLDLINAGIFNLNRTTFLVLDEADRMLDMGFEPQIRQILNLIRTDRQVLMWSATWPKNVQKLAHDMLGRDFIQVKIGSAELHANRKIQQKTIVCDNSEKKEKLAKILQEIWGSIPGEEGKKQMVRTIIFCNKKSTVEFLSASLYNDYWPVVSIHGDKQQSERDQAIRLLKSGEVSILVATDVAARGLDVKDVMVVINYDLPNDIESYVHRIGRTARGSAQEGTAYTFVTADDSGLVNDLVKIMMDAGQNIPEDLLRLRRPPRRGTKSNYGRGGYGYRAPGRTHQHTRFNPY